MKNIISYALAALLTASLAAVFPSAISESLPAASASDPSVSESALPENVVPDASETATSDLDLVPEDTQSKGEDALSPSAGNGENESSPADSQSVPPMSSSSGDVADEPAGEKGPEVAVAASEVPMPQDIESIQVEEAQGAEPALSDAPQAESIARFDEALCLDLADEQAGSLLGHYGLERSSACAVPAAVLCMEDYETSDDLDRNYAAAWSALRDAVAALATQECSAANCTYTDGALTLWI